MIGISEIVLSEPEIDAAVAVLKSGALRQGKECQAFEEEFAAATGAGFAVTCSNGTAALHMSYWDSVGPGDEVLVPAFTFIATGSMVTAVGAKPVFCDVDPDTFLLDLKDARARITERTRAIAPVHLFGNPCDSNAVTAFAQEFDLVIVADAAQAHGATYNGIDVGAFGDYAAYSFYPSKNMFVGEGGMVTVADADKAERLRNLRSHGQTGKYYHTSLGLNYRMTDVEAAIGRVQLTRLDEMVSVRRRNAELLHESLSEIPGLQCQTVTPGGNSSWHQFCVVIEPEEFGMTRDQLGRALHEAGVATGVHYPRGLHQQPVFEELYGTQTLPVTEYLAERILAIPVHHGLITGQVEDIVAAVLEAAR